MSTLYYKLGEERWRRIHVDKIKDIEKTPLWNSLAAYSGYLYVRYKLRCYKFIMRSGAAQGLLSDTLGYSEETYAVNGTVNYGTKGSAVWNADKAALCTILSVSLMCVFAVQVLVSFPYIPTWLLSLYFVYTRYKLLKEWK